MKYIWMVIISGLCMNAQPLKDYYDQLSKAQSAAPQFNDLLALMRSINGMNQSEVKEALPIIFTTLDHAAAGVFAIATISERKDGEALLEPYLGLLGTSLFNRNTRVQAGLLLTISRFHPQTIEKLKPAMIRVVQSRNAGLELRAGVIGILLSALRPSPPDVLAAASDLVQEPLGATKATVINQLAIPQLENAALIKFVQDGLNDRDPSVRVASISSLRRIGRRAFTPVLDKISLMSNNAAEDRFVRQRADELLRNVPEAPFGVGPLAPPGAPASSVKFPPQ